MANATPSPTSRWHWLPLIERFLLLTLVCLGATTIVAGSWARDYAAPRVTLLGSDRGISMLVTAGSARILIVNGTNSTQLGNALGKARHPGLERIDIAIVPGNTSAASLAPRVIQLFQPRMIAVVGGTASLDQTDIEPGKIIDHSTEFELPDGVVIKLEVWPSEGGDSGDVTWSALIQRGNASIYWVADREALLQNELPAGVDVIVFGRGKPTDDIPLPGARIIAAAGESINGPELRTIAGETIGPETGTLRVYAGDIDRIDLDVTGIRSLNGAIPASSPIANELLSHSTTPIVSPAQFRIQL